MIIVQVYEFFNPVSYTCTQSKPCTFYICLIISDYLHLCCLLMSHRYFSCRPCISSQRIFCWAELNRFCQSMLSLKNYRASKCIQACVQMYRIVFNEPNTRLTGVSVSEKLGLTRLSNFILCACNCLWYGILQVKRERSKLYFPELLGLKNPITTRNLNLFQVTWYWIVRTSLCFPLKSWLHRRITKTIQQQNELNKVKCEMVWFNSCFSRHEDVKHWICAESKHRLLIAHCLIGIVIDNFLLF